MMKPACAEHRNAQAAPNSSGSPNRFAGIAALRAADRLLERDALLLGGLLVVGAQPVGVERPGQHEVDGDVVLRHRARDAGEKGGEARARARRQVEARPAASSPSPR